MGLSLGVEAVHHLDLLEIGVVHHLSLPTEVTQRFLLMQNGYDLS